MCLHAYGIHSSTIQPEFADSAPLLNEDTNGDVELVDEEDTPLLQDTTKGCLFECVGGGDCMDNRCCDVPKDAKNGKDKKGDASGTSGSS